jgi:hypothetical protein
MFLKPFLTLPYLCPIIESRARDSVTKRLKKCPLFEKAAKTVAKISTPNLYLKF